ncbi:MAG: hypothetical protein ACREV5_17785 [Steroidobacter sp.]
MSGQDIHAPIDLQAEADAVRASGVLGKPGPLSRLFEFLLSRSAEAAPKELEIAIEVFGKGPAFDVSQDSVVRVYVHKLRRRLDDFYARNRRPARIAIPKGEYRLTFEALAPDREMAAPPNAPAKARSAWRRWTTSLAGVFGGALVLGAVIAFGLMKTLGMSAAERELRAVRESSIWAPLLDDDLPIAIVVGDYYVLGEMDDAGAVARLVREFHINSQADFIDHLELNPQRMQRYRNLDLTYLPAAAAFALRDLAPLLDVKERIGVMLMSELDSATLRGAHIVYIGYLSGLGMLGDPVFDASRLRLGGTYDELIDSATSQSYVARPPSTHGASYTDYGYFATLKGPEDNRIVIIAGTRDLGVIHTAEALTRPPSVAAITAQAGDAVSFESLTEVTGVAKASIKAQRLFVAEIEKEQIGELR